MAISIPVAVALGASSSPVATIPPGTCSFAISCSGTGTAYLGTASGVTTSTGFALAAGASVTIQAYPGSHGATLYGVASGAGPVVSVLISTAG